MRSEMLFAICGSALAAWGMIGCDAAETHDGPGHKPPGETASVIVIDFDRFDLGKTPPGFAADLTGGGGPVSWIVIADPTAPAGKKVLAQASVDSTGNRFPVCVCDAPVAKDVEVSVRFKPVSGKVDQSGGVIARYKDKDNYYVARANALEDNVRLYKVVDGKRTEIAGIKTKVAPGTWHELGLSVKGTHLIVTFDDKRFEADDSTFGAAGRVGLWTKADSVTHFDNLKFENLDRR